MSAAAGRSRDHHDPSRDAILPEERYLRRLLADVKAALAAGQTLAQAIETIPCDGAERWRLIEAFHKRNVSAAYAELEWE